MSSALFVPGDRLELVDKLRRRVPEEQPDRLIVDLEDGVAVSTKSLARNAVANAFASQQLDDGVVVRINADQLGVDDVHAICSAGDPIICVPKAEPRTVRQVVATVEALGRRPRVWALVESAAGLRGIDAIASIPGVVRLALGEVDLCAELGVAPGAAHALWPLRMQLVTAAALAGLPAPIGPISTDFSDTDRLERDSIELRDAGFDGRLAIHPAQLPVIHRVFTPAPDDLRRAHRLLARFDEAVAAGRGAVADDDGRMIDEAVVRSARRLIAKSSHEEER